MIKPKFPELALVYHLGIYGDCKGRTFMADARISSISAFYRKNQL